MNEEIIPTIMEEPEEIIDTINEDVVVLGVESLNGETGDLTLKTVNGNELLGEGDIEILAGVTSVNGETGDVGITAEGIGAATSSDLETEIGNRESADSNLQTAINGKQDQLSQTQLDAVDSGIDASKVNQISANTSNISSLSSSKQDKLSQVQMDAVNSGIDSSKVGQISTNTSNISSLSSSKQDKLSQNQLDAVNSGIDSSKVGQIATNANDISSIEGKIPAQASSENQLADKNFVNSSVATNTAYYISDNGEPFDSLADLEAYSGVLTNNDYAFVVGTDSAGNTTYTRYKYNADTGEWAEEYVLNNSSFTASQWDTINSGITSGDVSKLNGIESGAEVNVQANWNESDTTSDAYIQNKPTIPDAPVQSNWTESNSSSLAYIMNKPNLATVATTGSFDNLTDKKIYYGTCDTNANTLEKAVTTTLGDFELETGVTIFVAFTNKSSGSPATLNVDNTGAKPISTVTLSNSGTYNIWAEKEVVGFVYDGTRFVCFGRKTASTSNYGLAFYTTSATQDIEYTASTPASINNLAQNMIAGAPVYSNTATYEVGDRVRYGYNIYECKTAITTAESWNASHWTVLDSIQDQIDDVKATIPPDMVVLSYGSSTWNDFITAYQTNTVVYCRASSNSDPATGSQTRMAFMAYVNNATTPTSVEFQYYRSVSSKTASQQGDQVFVYTLTNANGGTWSVITREAASKIVAGTNMTSSYSSGTLTLDATDTTYSAFTGTDGTSAGTSGLVPAPATTDAGKFLKADGTWDTAGSSITVETTPGISDTSVMSQKAVTGMIFRINANDYSDHAIKIGGESTTSNSAVAIGHQAAARDNYAVAIGKNADSRRWAQVSIGYSSGGAVSGAIYGVSVGYYAQQSANISGAIALGAYSKPTATGEMNIGSTDTSCGYNSSNYRLITGVYDGQSAHDACTKGQLDTAVGNVESILQTLNSGSGV